jgi:hypothetical protein
MDLSDIVALSVVGERRLAETDLYAMLSSITMSNIPGETQVTRTIASGVEGSSDCKVIARSYRSPTNRRDASDVHGEECLRAV